MEISWRPMRTGDMDRFVEIWGQYAKILTSTQIEPYREGLEGWQEYGREIGLDFYAVDQDEEMIGFLIFNEMESGIYVDQIALDKEYTGRGIGTSLLKLLEVQTTSEITTQILFNNLIGINFLISRGFRITGFNQRKDGYRLKKDLSSVS